MTKEEILDALKAVKYPPYSKDIVSFGMVKYVKIDGKKAEIKIFTGGAEDTAKAENSRRNTAKDAAAILWPHINRIIPNIALIF